mmetsp:Transcript_43184/g.94149  ORF Transcript_43184/g.94149 Transcript_43184/m.94149 type:complete len:293 (-) Transcript_43184:256-1134(-)
MVTQVDATNGVCADSRMSEMLHIPRRFLNDDACGDWVVPFGPGLEVQCVNALSAMFFVLAGAQVLGKVESSTARAYGTLMICVGIGSCSFHATSSLVSFMIDIVPMAASAAVMLFQSVHALQLEAGCRGRTAELHRLGVSIGAAFLAIYIPFVMMQVGSSHYHIWGVWAILFGSMGVPLGIASLQLFYQEGILWGPCGMDLFVAIGCILVGLGCTTHSFIPGQCTGWRTAFPFHAAWHFFSAITANRCGHILDSLTALMEKMEAAPPALRKSTPNLFSLRMLRDAIPSQFSM